jgi:hypothetical protein
MSAPSAAPTASIASGVIVLDASVKPVEGFEYTTRGRGGVPVGTCEYNGFKGSSPLHGFVLALHRAFAEHRALRLTPDDLWTLVVQGIGAHVSRNPEKLRAKFVAHEEGKKVVRIHRNGFRRGHTDAGDWMGVVEELSVKAREAQQNIAGSDFTGRMVQNFSTTQPLNTFVYRAAVLATLGHYMSYRVMSFCGIPRVELVGTVEDWKCLRDAVVELKLLELDTELETWNTHIVSITESLLRARQNAAADKVDPVDIDFFKSIYKYNSGSGGDRVTGWVTQLFPYLGSGEQTAHHLLKDRAPWGVPSDAFPTGLTNVPFVWEYFGTDLPMTMFAGFDDAVLTKEGGVECAYGFAVQYNN